MTLVGVFCLANCRSCDILLGFHALPLFLVDLDIQNLLVRDLLNLPRVIDVLQSLICYFVLTPNEVQIVKAF